MTKKAQSSIEFFILVGIAFFFFVSFLFILLNNIEQKNSEKIDSGIREVALNVQDEISLAHSANDGYSRNFSIPLNILWKNYSASVISNSIYIVTEDQKNAISLNILNVSGQIKKGQNSIKNVGGQVFLN